APPAPPPSVAPSPPPCRLPVQLASFVAREEEIAWITETLRYPDVRLVTLTGPGGTGKTRLAIAAAWRLVPAWDEAVWFVPLADVGPAPQATDGAAEDAEERQRAACARIVEAIADVLALPRTSETPPLEQVVEALGSQPALLVLDNYEHLV